MSDGKLAWWTNSQRSWVRKWMRATQKGTERLLAHGQSLYSCWCVFHPLSALLWQPRVGGKVLSARWSGCTTGYTSPAAVRSEGFTSGPLGEEPVFTASASLPNLCTMSPAWICYTSFKWIYGPINGESLCIIKSRADLSGIQFNNYWSNSIIFRYVVSVSEDLEDLLRAFDRQDNTFYCSVTKPVLHRPCTHLIYISKLQKDWIQVWSLCLSPDLEKDVQRTPTCTSLYLKPSSQVNYEKFLLLCFDKWLI